MKKLLSLVLALIIAAAIPLAVFADSRPEITVWCEEGGSPVAEIISENEEVYRIRVTFNPDKNMELDFVSATAGLGAFEQPLMFEDEFPFAPAFIDFDAPKDCDSVTVAVAFKQTSAPASMKGDLDGDKEITVSDALRALRIAAKLVQPTEEDIATGDVDYDGEITVSDALKILRVAAKLATQESLESAR
ncbi:MAG: dockerin type I repeat-containing protein [Clostridia bacterium]|nr:dockerin type I repeat-containing protein [Clostridia bacterium]MBR5769186.1 dockerin type I repeat-containing protein [Clostridia bacterium]